MKEKKVECKKCRKKFIVKVGNKNPDYCYRKVRCPYCRNKILVKVKNRKDRPY